MMVLVPLPTGSAPNEFREHGDTRLINAYASPMDSQNGAYTVKATPGLKRMAVLPDVSGCRGWIEADGFIYAVYNGGVFKIEISSWVCTKIGFISGTGDVFLARNDASPFQIAVVTQSGRYYVIENDEISPIGVDDLLVSSDGVSLGRINSICWHSGYLFLGVSDGRVFNTEIRNARKIGGLDYFTAEGSPDGIVRVVAHRLETIVFGKQSIEIWPLDYNPPATGSPCTRQAVIERGCCSAQSIVAADNTLYWADNYGMIVRNEGGIAKRVSTQFVEMLIARTDDKSQIRGALKIYDGNNMLEWSGPGWTVVYNIGTGKWHEESGLYSKGSVISNYLVVDGVTYAATSTDGNIYKLTSEEFDIDGEPIKTVIRFSSDNLPTGSFVSMAEIDCVTGRAAIAGSQNEKNPVVVLRWSDDGGSTWSTERSLSLGARGQYTHRIRTTRLGKTGIKWGRMWEICFTDPHVRSISRFNVDVEAPSQ